MNDVLKISGLCAEIEDKKILKGVDLEIKTGEVHAIMGPNGTGKSTLSSIIMGQPKYKVTSGDISLNGESILNLAVDERARKGIFLAYQYPAEVPGVTNSDFIRSAMKATTGKDVSLFSFIRSFDKACQELKMPDDLAHRYLNEGFSGGEKKRNEILQMKMLKPKFAILDEIDSGLDVDALRIVGENVQNMVSDNFGCLLITHYERLLDYIKPDYVHIMINGKIVKTGGKELIAKIDQQGYDWVKEELGIQIESEEEKRSHALLGACAHAGK
ncbi:TPA: Fe-S cluster assembly ATPase SufC [Candidatus Avacholeplasma faecigallinarum]|nr:Fe-S cluster assembly ATPase SufC [Candidatus Avacholeplasma faecigallinarum]